MEDLSNTEDYKKAYQRADRICRFMPHMIDKMATPEQETPAQKKAFEDRITEYHIEQDGMKHMPHSKLFKKYGSKLLKYNAERNKDQDRTKD